MQYLLILVLLVVIVIILVKRTQKRRRVHFILHYEFHELIEKKLRAKYPHLEEKDIKLVFQALRDYFYICFLAKKKAIAMPSQVVDVAWHEFILMTKEYESFCSQAFGNFLHHTPTEAMKTKTTATDGIKRAWKFACEYEKINPKEPNSLPLLFAIDSLLNIEDGYKYSLDCKKTNGDYCASHIGCSSSSCSSDGSGCSSCSGGGD